MDRALIDIHTHIVPGLDDGARDLEQAVAMAQVAVKDGIKTLVATPHVMRGSFEYSRAEIIKRVENLNLCLKVQNLKLSVLPGAEYYLETDLPERLAAGELLTINDNGRYLLVEFPATIVPQGSGNILQALFSEGVRPIIAHPERNQHLVKHPEILERFAARGILSQVTSRSLTGENGREAREMGIRFLQTGVSSIVASDAHSARTRPPVLSAAFQEVEKLLGSELASTVFCQNPWRVVRGLPTLEATPLTPLGALSPSQEGSGRGLSRKKLKLPWGLSP